MRLPTTDLNSRRVSLGAVAAAATPLLAQLSSNPFEDASALVVVTITLVVGMGFAGWVSNRESNDWILQAGVSLLVNWVVAHVVGLVMTAAALGGRVGMAEIGMGLMSTANFVWPGHVIGVAIARRGAGTQHSQ